MSQSELRTEFLILKDENDSCNSIETFKNLLNSCASFKVTAKEFRHKGFLMYYELSTNTLNNGKAVERYFHLVLTRKSEGDIEKEADIPKINNAIKDLRSVINTFGNGLRLIKLWDDISVYQSEKAYPLLHEIENLMRQLIMKFMLMQLGTAWLDTAVPHSTKKTIEDNAKRNKKASELIERGLFEADFIDLADFLFKEYSTFKEGDFFKVIRNAKPEDTIKANKYKDLLPKSNWDRYFSKLIEIEGLNKKWKRLYDLRNLIAHNRHLTTKEFDEITELTSEMRLKLIDAISKIGAQAGINNNDNNKHSTSDQQVVKSKDDLANPLSGSALATMALLLNPLLISGINRAKRRSRIEGWNPERELPLEAMTDLMKGAHWNYKDKLLTLIANETPLVINDPEELVRELDAAAIAKVNAEMPLEWLKQQNYLDYEDAA